MSGMLRTSRGWLVLSSTCVLLCTAPVTRCLSLTVCHCPLHSLRGNLAGHCLSVVFQQDAQAEITTPAVKDEANETPQPPPLNVSYEIDDPVDDLRLTPRAGHSSSPARYQ